MKIKKLSTNIFYALLLTIIIVSADFIFKLMEPQYLVMSSKIAKEAVGLFLISLILISMKQKKLRVLFLIFFTLLSFIELAHYSFFHGLLMHYEITFFFTQFSEVKDSTAGLVKYMWVPLAIWIVQLIIGYFILRSSEKKVLSSKYVFLLLILILIAVPYSAHNRHNISSMMPNNKSLSIRNVYNAVSLFVGKEIPKHFTEDRIVKHFEKYEVERNSIKKPQTIIFVMGESLGYKYMHIFDAKKENTPNLDKLKKDKNFIYKKAYSSGVDTLTAVPTFFLLKREPENISLLGQTYTNLLSLAKKSGYTVSYITTQKLNIMAPFVGDADNVIRLKGKDEVLIGALDNIDFSKKNFIILHQRNSHSPYADFTPAKFHKYPFETKDFHTHMMNSYANSILYTDYILGKLIERVKHLPNSVFFMVPDHAEMMGMPDENGRYGHAFLSKEVARIPAFIYSNGIDEKLVDGYNKMDCVNHYTVGKEIAKTLGYTIHNPNENGKYFIQGTIIDGTDGFIEYSNKECKNLNIMEK